MKNKFLNLLILLIALQSSISMADFYQPHHSEEEHTQTVISDQSLSKDELESHHTSLDTISHSCHHYCASPALTYIDINELFTQINFQKNIALQIIKAKSYSSRTLIPDLRPPIA